MIGVLAYFLRFHIKQSERGILINKERYVKDLLRKYDKFGSSVNTLIVPPNMLGPSLNGKAVNESQYKGMIGSLMNLTASRPDYQFSTGLYARHQANIRNPTLVLTKKDIETLTVLDATWTEKALHMLIKNHTLKGDIKFHFITQYQLADIFIKLLDKPSFKRFIDELGLEVGSIRRIQVLDTAYWGFLGVGTTLDIFQNIHILYLQYGVLSFIPLWSLYNIGESLSQLNKCRSKHILHAQIWDVPGPEVSLDLSRLDTTLNRLERSYQTGIYKASG
ncbi:hypothetical protein Tco_0926496 [Tanacetum coccineum]|uniref:Reverse transcriptase Ty1/copia-type domain-containing protein n=1 Tax=Tanacetum coccineum TaxID=301880 RepID=A0ABQ5DCL9_9ASTR